MTFKRLVPSVAVACIWVALLTSFPHFFTYEVGMALYLILLSLAMMGGLSGQRWFPSGSGLRKISHNLEAAFPLLLLLGVSAFCFSALNEKLFAIENELHSHRKGGLTIGGLFPRSDSNGHLQGILTFLQFGEMNGQAVYRPFAHLFSSFLFRISGNEWIGFFHSSTALVVLAVWFHALVVARHLGRLVALVGAFLLCLFFSRFLATFMTEVTGGAYGAVGVALLVHGLFDRSLRSYLVGMGLFIFGTHMRFGVVYFLPLLIPIGGLRFRRSFRHRFFALAVCLFFFAAFYALPLLQFRMFRIEVRQANSYSQQVYQVMRNSDTWRVYSKAYPGVKPDGTPMSLYDRTTTGHKDVMGRLRSEPGLFLRNYAAMMRRYAVHPERFITPWAEKVPTPLAMAVLIFFSSGVFLHARGTPHRLFTLFGLAYLACCFLATPILNEYYDRLYAVSLSINTLIAAAAVHNIAAMTLLLGRRFGMARPSQCIPSFEGPSTDCQPRIRFAGPWLVTFPVCMLVAAFFGPLAVDRLRDTGILAYGHTSRFGSDGSTSVAVVSPKRSPYILHDMNGRFRIVDPREVPGDRFESGEVGRGLARDTAFTGRFLLMQTIDLVQAGKGYTGSFTLMIPDSLLKGAVPADLDTLVVRIDSPVVFKHGVMFSKARRVLGFGAEPQVEAKEGSKGKSKL